MIVRYALDPFAKDSGYRLPRAPTMEDRQRAQQVRQDPSGCLWYSLEQGDELMLFTHATNAEKKWKRLGMLVKMFVRQADIRFVFTAHEMYMERRRKDQAEVVYGREARPVMNTSAAASSTIWISSGRRTASNVEEWRTEYGYGLPMSRMTPNGFALTDPSLVENWNV